MVVCGVGCTIVHLLLVTGYVPLGGVLVRGGISTAISVENNRSYGKR